MDRIRPTRRQTLATAGAVTIGALAGCLGDSEAGAYTTDAANTFEGVVDGQWLTAHRDEVERLDVRDEDAFTDGHLPDAHRLTETIHDVYEETDDGPEVDLDSLAAALAAAGIEPDDEVVVYGEETTMWATHGVYTLRAIGHEGAVFLLDGGLEAWTDADGDLESGSTADATESADESPSIDDSVLATREAVAAEVHEDDADVVLVDNRTPAEYIGDDDADQHDRYGHIPGAINLHFPQTLTDGRLRSPDDLETLWLTDADLEPDEATISYCTTGVRGSVGWFVMDQLGWEDVRVYDGSWDDWGTLSEADGYYYTSGEDSGRIVDALA